MTNVEPDNVGVEGKAPFSVQGLSSPCETWYKVFGDLTDDSKTPLFVVHGGPAAGHEYLLSLSNIAAQVVFYDQIGAGRSTELKEKHSDENFWTVELFCEELSNLIDHLGLKERRIDLLGHSWGAMLSAEWASDPSRAHHLRRLVLYSGPASSADHVAGLNKLREGLPLDIQEDLNRGDLMSPEYKAAMQHFSQKHLSLSRPFPCEEILPALTGMAASEMHHTMFGPSILRPTGTLRNWTSVPRLHRIKVPTLLITGSQEHVHDIAAQPFFDHIPRIRWITFDDTAHFAHIERREKFLVQVNHFLVSPS